MERIDRNLYFYILIILASTGSIESKVYTVGDGDGWSTGTDYQVWSQKYNFTVGDVLAFDYVKGQHNAFEVTENSYRTCDTEGNGSVMVRYESGNDQVVLTQARKYWFVCDIPGHCLGGMKFGIDVVASTDGNIAPGSADEQPLAPETSGVLRLQGRPGGGGGVKAWINYVIVAFGVSLIIPN